ncbi:uncharacterized protein LOC111693965 [Trichogramma pretiosum]|uniref:uncharacterized protein LOC111693965 n=1 Tax=Trichogramma pretiosum TaxID=7493 RepID=UPI000C71A054|nr:uncharacterized protein LOC111693965 [Trichogramma pretiosum]
MTNCPICVNGHEPSQHSCIICSKFVHLHEQCSKSVDGEEEGSSEKRICLECDLRNVEIFTSNCFESEKTAVVEKNEKQTVQQDDDKQSLKDFFHYEKVEDMKHGFCLICGKDESGNYKTKIPMKASNTTGLKSHLQHHHRKQYEKLFPLETSRKKSSNTKLQSTLDRFSIVSNFNNLICIHSLITCDRVYRAMAILDHSRARKNLLLYSLLGTFAMLKR